MLRDSSGRLISSTLDSGQWVRSAASVPPMVSLMTRHRCQKTSVTSYAGSVTSDSTAFRIHVNADRTQRIRPNGF